MNNKIKIIISIIIALFISACGDSSDMKKVKEYVLEGIDSSRTIATAMEARNACKKYKWEESTSLNGKKLVIFTCDIDYASINETFNRINKSKIDKIQSDINKLKTEQRLMKEQLPLIMSVYSMVKKYIPLVEKLESQYIKLDWQSSDDEAMISNKKLMRKLILYNKKH